MLLAPQSHHSQGWKRASDDAGDFGFYNGKKPMEGEYRAEQRTKELQNGRLGELIDTEISLLIFEPTIVRTTACVFSFIIALVILTAMIAILELLKHDAEMQVGGIHAGDHIITGLPFLYN